MVARRIYFIIFYVMIWCKNWTIFWIVELIIMLLNDQSTFWLWWSLFLYTSLWNEQMSIKFNTLYKGVQMKMHWVICIVIRSFLLFVVERRKSFEKEEEEKGAFLWCETAKRSMRLFWSMFSRRHFLLFVDLSQFSALRNENSGSGFIVAVVGESFVWRVLFFLLFSFWSFLPFFHVFLSLSLSIGVAVIRGFFENKAKRNEMTRFTLNFVL